MTQYDRLTRDELRLVASEIADRVQNWATGRTMTESDQWVYMRKMARATFMATMALSAPEGDAPVPATPELTPEPQEDIQSPSGTYTYQGITYDLGARYDDRDGDTWWFTGEPLPCGMPRMTYGDGDVETLAIAVKSYGPFAIVGTPPPYEGLTCDECGARHDPEGT